MFHLLASRTDFDTQTWAAANSCAHPVFILLLLLLWGTGCWAKRLSRGHRGPAEEGERRTRTVSAQTRGVAVTCKEHLFRTRTRLLLLLLQGNDGLDLLYLSPVRRPPVFVLYFARPAAGQQHLY